MNLLKFLKKGVKRSDLLEIKRILENIVLTQEISNLVDKVKGLETSTKQEKMSVPSQPLDQAIEELKSIAGVRWEIGGTAEFLLHRLTEDGEYNKSVGVDRSFTTTKNTSWVPIFETADREMDQTGGTNPLVSCWVPGALIHSIPVGAPNTGTWGTMGKNPHSSQYEIIVKPGKYELYQELKE